LKALGVQASELDEKLKGFANLDQEFREQHEAKDKFAQDHTDRRFP
jgi:hypothetical protein